MLKCSRNFTISMLQDHIELYSSLKFMNLIDTTSDNNYTKVNLWIIHIIACQHMPVEGHIKPALSYLKVLSVAVISRIWFGPFHLLPAKMPSSWWEWIAFHDVIECKMTLMSLIYFFGCWFKWWWTVDKARKYWYILSVFIHHLMGSKMSCIHSWTYLISLYPADRYSHVTSKMVLRMTMLPALKFY